MGLPLARYFASIHGRHGKYKVLKAAGEFISLAVLVRISPQTYGGQDDILIDNIIT
jgi:hypothetical protein